MSEVQNVDWQNVEIEIVDSSKFHTLTYPDLS
jgi:hypothetical protein